MKKGFMYLTAIIDVYSRFIVGWSLHNSLDASHCIEVLQNAIETYGSPEIINSDQGCQFTCKAWLDACAQHPQLRVSMDGRVRAKDNIWIERFWKTINMSIFTSCQRKTGRRSTAESRDSLLTTTTIEGIKESTVKYQASSTFVRQLD